MEWLAAIGTASGWIAFGLAMLRTSGLKDERENLKLTLDETKDSLATVTGERDAKQKSIEALEQQSERLREKFKKLARDSDVDPGDVWDAGVGMHEDENR